VAVFIIEVIVNYCVLQETNAKFMKISHPSLFLAIGFKFSIMFNRVNLHIGICDLYSYRDNRDNEQHYQDIKIFDYHTALPFSFF